MDVEIYVFFFLNDGTLWSLMTRLLVIMLLDSISYVFSDKNSGI